MFSKNDDLREAVTRYEKMLLEHETIFFDSYQYEDIILYYLEYAKYAKAKQALEVALSQYPTASALRLLQVEILIYEDNLQQAGEILDDILHEEPYNAEIHVQRANLYSKKNDHIKAIELLKYAASLSEELSDIHSLIAMEYMYMEEYALAKKYFKKCLAKDPEDYFSLQQLLHCFDFLKEDEQAIAFLTEFLDENPYCEVAWHSLGKQYMVQNNLQEALRAFDFAIISDDTFTGAYFEKGKVLELLKNYKQAIENYKITLSLDDPSSFAYLRIGICYEKLGESEMAEQYYFKAVHEDPQSSKAWLALVEYYVRENNYTKAEKYVSKVLLNEGDNPSFLRRCAEVYAHVGRREDAIQIYTQAIDLGDYSVEIRNELSDLLLQEKAYERALMLSLSTLHLYPQEVSAYYRIGIAYHMLGEKEKEYTYLGTALKQGGEWLAYFEKKYPEVFSFCPLVKEIVKNTDKH